MSTTFFIDVNYKAKNYRLNCEIVYMSSQTIQVKVFGKRSTLLLQNDFPISKLGSKGVKWQIKDGNISDADLLSEIFRMLEYIFKYSNKNKQQVIFSLKGKDRLGFLEPITGSSEECWHLMVDNFYWGRLRNVTGKWVFDPTPKTEELKDMADYFGQFAVWPKPYSHPKNDIK
jgi:hypothetical protein